MFSTKILFLFMAAISITSSKVIYTFDQHGPEAHVIVKRSMSTRIKYYTNGTVNGYTTFKRDFLGGNSGSVYLTYFGNNGELLLEGAWHKYTANSGAVYSTWTEQVPNEIWSHVKLITVNQKEENPFTTWWNSVFG